MMGADVTMDALREVPCRVLGHQVKTRTQIVVSSLVPAIFEFLVYVVVMTADVLVAIEHFRNGNRTWGAFTLIAICLPSAVTFCSILSSPAHWPDAVGCDGQTWRFIWKNVLILVLFPLAAMYRYNRRIFWSIEALFHDKTSYGRVQAVAKITESSPCELYHFLQAFLQAAPQMLLQLYILLRENIFRNYDTVTVQIVSIVFSFITMATIVTTFQRFESQKIVGRVYPWCTTEQAQARKRKFNRETSTVEAVLATTPSVAPESDPIVPNIMRNFYTKFGSDDSGSATSSSNRKTLNIDENNFNRQQSKGLPDPYTNFTDDDKLSITVSDTVDNSLLGRSVSFKQDTESEYQAMADYLRRTENSKEQADDSDDEYLKPDTFDEVPRTPAPPTPGERNVFQRMSVYRHMLLFNAGTFIKDHVPRLPPGMFPDEDDPPKRSTAKAAKTSADQTDGDMLSLPSRRQMIVGLEQDDVIGQVVSFVGWVLFLLMRMLSLSTFYVFFPLFFWMLVGNHYLLMIACIVYEVRTHEKLERYFFYIFLAYIYVFSLLEFKIRFIHVRWWYVGYIMLMFLENIVTLVVWYNLGTYESWWFGFMHHVIIASGGLSALCFLFYYIYLRPKDKVLFVN